MEADSYGISAGGRLAERLFRKLTGAETAPQASDGDASLDGHLVEIKQTTTNTLNQVRAVKYLPLVVYHVNHRRWYVVPPNELVRIVSKKTRGQHTEIPFECSTVNLNALEAFLVDRPGDLRTATVRAVEEGAAHPELRQEMTQLLERIRGVADESLAAVRSLLEESQGEG